MKNKKIIIGISIAVIIIAIVIGIILISEANGNSSSNKSVNYGIDSLVSFSDKIAKTPNYSFETTLNEENYKTISKNNDSVKIEVEDEGDKQTYIINGNTTYLLSENTKKYTKYSNNTSMLNDLENKLKEIQRKTFNTGKEEIDGKEYSYEEFEKTSAFLINFKRTVDNSNTKTRFYFENGNLKYIRTYVGEVQQLLKVKLEFNNQNGKYDIPEGYSKK
ncbi:MAG: hypothetical protein J6N78_00620 [Clostridia bacterium]|nr:hypothetical protein [Clostridia bacterium]